MASTVTARFVQDNTSTLWKEPRAHHGAAVAQAGGSVYRSRRVKDEATHRAGIVVRQTDLRCGRGEPRSFVLRAAVRCDCHRDQGDIARAGVLPAAALRLSRNRPFRIYKIPLDGRHARRSVGPRGRTVPGDARVTRVGRVSAQHQPRRDSPAHQRIKGDMSLVGPRRTCPACWPRTCSTRTSSRITSSAIRRGRASPAWPRSAAVAAARSTRGSRLRGSITFSIHRDMVVRMDVVIIFRTIRRELPVGQRLLSSGTLSSRTAERRPRCAPSFRPRPRSRGVPVALAARHHLMHRPASAEIELSFLDRIVRQRRVTAMSAQIAGSIRARGRPVAHGCMPSSRRPGWRHCCGGHRRRTCRSTRSALSDPCGEAELLIPQGETGSVQQPCSLEPQLARAVRSARCSL